MISFFFGRGGEGGHIWVPSFRSQQICLLLCNPSLAEQIQLPLGNKGHYQHRK